ncbi:MAG: DegT/DnrJ/EryC1/StrS family aminotransferase [Chitinophagaceae bacterium]|nr:DegT/DnrJ/EryC1/StrS family aminotransferase [Chitinophagaceae bacterium]MCB9046921.1 DegT/DnrJ/EryC1/StrS family aminotransferase [Chitinophagales bacterium]
MHVPFVDLHAQYQSIKPDIDKAIQDVIAKTAFIGGEYVKSFEKEFAELYGVKHVVSCANGTDSLYIIMKMLGIGEGDEVITAANSWISSSETISQTGARPAFTDPDDTYMSMSAGAVAKAVTPATKAVLVVHLHGQMCDMEGIQQLCKEKNIYLIEDCAQSHFSEYKGERAATMGIAGSFSFYPGKNLGAYGDAGCIVTNDDELADKCRMYANHGALKKHQHQIEGINSRLDGLQASVLSAKLPHILKWTEQRIANAALYNKYLDGISNVKLPVVRPETKHTFHLYMIRAEKRDELQQHLKQCGVDTALHYPTALPNLPAYKYLGTTPADFPVATQLQGEILSLPMYPELTKESIKYIADCIRGFYN